MKAESLWIVEPGLAELRSEELAALPADRVLVRTEVSAFSPGTERLFFEGSVPLDLPIDSHLPSLRGTVAYPLKYGYSAVGRVVETGSSIDEGWLGQRVFAFHPHESLFQADPADLVPLPSEADAEAAALLANVETALTLVQDGRPLAGERVVLHGLGVVGLLTTSLLARFPLANLVAVDPLEERRELARQRGAAAGLDPTEPEAPRRLSSLLGDRDPRPQADLSYELSGNSAALNLAIETTAFSGRIVVGSWYGTKPLSLNLGGRFHRGRLRLISSQVSTINPVLSGRWTKDRRLAEALRLLPELRPQELITHRLPFSQAPDAYHLLEPEPDRLAVLLRYNT